MLSTKIVHNETEAIMKSHYAKKKRYFQNFKSFSKSFELFKYDFITALPPLCIVGYWLLRNFLNQYQINLLPTHPPPYDVFCILFMIFFVCCLFVTMMFNIACLKQDYLWFLGKPNYSIFEFENFLFFSLLFPTVLQSNRIHYYFLWISSHQELSFLLTLMRKENVTI